MMPLAIWKARIANLPAQLLFWKFPIDSRSVFHTTELSFAFTNLKPVIPGHVLVSPIRVVDRLSDLSTEEVADLFVCARFVGDVLLKTHPHADSLTFTVQDGSSAGQSVKHVHVHVMPRWSTDRFNRSTIGNDSVYEEINQVEVEMGHALPKVDESVSEPDRCRDDMVAEAAVLRVAIERALSRFDESLVT
jgi:bis(5'-adenosyl)-triphosphatase